MTYAVAVNANQTRSHDSLFLYVGVLGGLAGLLLSFFIVSAQNVLAFAFLTMVIPALLGVFQKRAIIHNRQYAAKLFWGILWMAFAQGLGLVVGFGVNAEYAEFGMLFGFFAAFEFPICCLLGETILSDDT